MRHSCHAVSAPAFPTALPTAIKHAKRNFCSTNIKPEYIAAPCFNVLPLLAAKDSRGSILLARRAGYQLAKRLSNKL